MRPLAQTTIIEINSAGASTPLRLASSLATKIAADLGARVIKLEPAGGDPVRTLPPLLPAASGSAESALFQFLNSSKLALRLPEDRPAALDLLLAGKVDAVVAEEGEPGLALAQARGIPTVELAGWPLGMPQSRLSELTVLALGGLLHMVGDPDREPLRLGGHQAPYAAGLAAFTALMALLTAVDEGQAPAPARVSLVETVFWVNWKAVAAAHADGVSPVRQGAAAEFRVLPCRDGHIALVFTANQFDAVRELTGDPALADSRFATRQGRRQHAAALNRLLEPWFAARRREEIYTAAQTLQIPLGPTYAPADLLADPQYVARGFLAELIHPAFDGLRMPKLPVRWDGNAFAPRPMKATTIAALTQGRQS